MSVVTNVILTGMMGCDPCADLTNSVIVALNKYLVNPAAERNLGELLQVDQHAGGRKHMECFVWMGAFNYLDIDDFMQVYQEAVANPRLRYHDSNKLIQMFMKRQDDDVFSRMSNEPDGRHWHYRTGMHDTKK